MLEGCLQVFIQFTNPILVVLLSGTHNSENFATKDTIAHLFEVFYTYHYCQYVVRHITHMIELKCYMG